MKRVLITVFVVFLIAAGSAWIWAERYPSLPAVSAEEAETFSQDEIRTGFRLVSIGGCASCHTDPGKAEFSGGRALPTPFGVIYSTNITPDRETGIGHWSEQAFRRAMRQGVDREGRYLYPAFPFDHFTLVTDEDIRAIYAYLKARSPVRAEAPVNGIAFPLNIRLLMAGWSLLYHAPGPFAPDPGQGAVWNRGAYLVEGLGHCAACHSPRNLLGARDRERDYAGGVAEGWHSPALDRTSPTAVPWTEEALVNYLFDGWEEMHGIAAGPMRVVVGHTSALSEEDVAAIANYLIWLQRDRPDDDGFSESALSFAERVAYGGNGPVGPPSSEASSRGLIVFEKRCANCHRSGTESVPLALATAVTGPDPRNFLRIVLEGAKPTENAFYVRPMPGFPTLSAGELHDLAVFVRERYSRAAPWIRLGDAILEVLGDSH